eukprot:3100775-Rhodomonas_salina.2
MSGSDIAYLTTRKRHSGRFRRGTAHPVLLRTPYEISGLCDGTDVRHATTCTQCAAISTNFGYDATANGYAHRAC